MIQKCSICNDTNIKPLYPGVLKCQRCGYVFSEQCIPDGELFKSYGKGYFSGGEYSDYLADKKVMQKNFKLRLKTLQNFLKPERHKNLLEIGCAYGFFLDIAKNTFNSVCGIDITEEGTRYAREELKLDVDNDDFLKHDFNNRQFDVVCMWDTIEHLGKPQGYLEKIGRNMGPGGLVAITTGDIESFNARISKDKWRLLTSPTHIHYFSKKVLKNMLNKYGFDVVYSRYCGFYRSIDMTIHRIALVKKNWMNLYNVLHKSRLSKLDFYSNLYDVMYVIARKR